MNARELITRIVDLEARVAELEGAAKALEAASGKADDVAQIDARLQSMEDWRQTFERPKRDILGRR
jgi:hypothetical protein